jgi:hypothetical protein
MGRQNVIKKKFFAESIKEYMKREAVFSLFPEISLNVNFEEVSSSVVFSLTGQRRLLLLPR